MHRIKATSLILWHNCVVWLCLFSLLCTQSHAQLFQTDPTRTVTYTGRDRELVVGYRDELLTASTLRASSRSQAQSLSFYVCASSLLPGDIRVQGNYCQNDSQQVHMNKMLCKALCWPQTPLHPFHVGFLTELQFSFFSHTANISESNHSHIAVVIRKDFNRFLWLLVSYMTACVLLQSVCNIFSPLSECTSATVSTHKGTI